VNHGASPRPPCLFTATTNRASYGSDGYRGWGKNFACSDRICPIIGAKTGGAIALQFAADHPARTRTLAVASGPASVRAASNPSNIPQRDRLGSGASKEMVEYWNNMFATAPEEGVKGLGTALSKFDLARDGVLQRITAPTLVITSDQSALQTVEKVRQYQLLIPKSRLVVLHSDAYHIAAANADECVTNVLAFIKETRQRA
jgi:pimeloyl-ACP methyl ester carboxylesterase